MKNKVTREEELDYMNKRLVYVNDLYRGFTTTGMIGVKDNIISTDQVISLFDGGYRLGLMDLSQLQKYDLENFKLHFLDTLHKLMSELDRNESINKEVQVHFEEMKTLLGKCQITLRKNSSKLFDACEQSNRNDVQDIEEKNRNEEFMDHLFRTYSK
ncbi:hypothetical protein G6699_07315 [Polynucleobacter paneuropaeus]|jgi:hypothetical protein|nr:hypothetical protein [Polynucleobacter paneuropaeus]